MENISVPIFFFDLSTNFGGNIKKINNFFQHVSFKTLLQTQISGHPGNKSP